MDLLELLHSACANMSMKHLCISSQLDESTYLRKGSWQRGWLPMHNVNLSVHAGHISLIASKHVTIYTPRRDDKTFLSLLS